MKGYDSESEPSLAQAHAAKANGITWWGFYIRGPGARHDWSESGTTTLEQAGILPLPIFVPALTSGGLISSQTPETDAQEFVAAYRARGIEGAGALDTEAEMRGDPWTSLYEQRFTAEMGTLAQAAITYAGGFTMGSPLVPAAPHKWWINVPGDPAPADCYQNGGGTVEGISVDYDFAGDDFPVAHFGHKPITEVDMFVRNPDTGEICLCGPSGAVNLGSDWPTIQAAYKAAGVPLVLVESASLQARFTAIATY